METVTLYHGTRPELVEKILREGLDSERSGVFLTDSLEAAYQYGEAVFEVELPAMGFQPNGSPAPPFFEDDWHRDSGMPGEGYEYDARITPKDLKLLTSTTY